MTEKRKYKSVAFSDGAIDSAVEDGIMCVMPPEKPYEICDAKISGIEMSREELLDLLESGTPARLASGPPPKSPERRFRVVRRPMDVPALREEVERLERAGAQEGREEETPDFMRWHLLTGVLSRIQREG